MKETQILWHEQHCPIKTFGEPIYEDKPPLFSWIGRKVKEGHQQVTTWHRCRETFICEIGRLCGAIKTKSPDYKDLGTTKRLKIAVLFRVGDKWASKRKFDKSVAELSGNMKEGLRLVNVLERYMGWSLSKLYKVKDDTQELSDNKLAIYCLFGSPKWMRSAPLTSLYLLLIRLGNSKPKKITSSIKKVSDFAKLGSSIKYYKKGDLSHLRMIYKKIKIILDNREDLFFSRTMVENYTKNNGFNGILALSEHRCDKFMTDQVKRLFDPPNAPKTRGRLTSASIDMVVEEAPPLPLNS